MQGKWEAQARLISRLGGTVEKEMGLPTHPKLYANLKIFALILILPKTEKEIIVHR